jgi:hypothetical protein
LTAKVTSLHGAAVAGTREPDADIVEKLEEFLAEAKSGRIHGIGFVVVIDDHVKTGWSGQANRHYMLAGASRLQWRMAEDYENAEIG